MSIGKHFREHSVAEFFKKNRQMLGFSGKTRSLTTIIHEYVTNSLDACEEYGILPEIKISLSQTGKDRYLVSVRDNGPGIPKSHIGKALGMMLAGTKFHRFMQQRGQQGIGAAGCTMYSFLTTGKPIGVVSGNGNSAFSCTIRIDVKSNRPEISEFSDYPPFRGLEITAEFGDVKYDRGQYGAFEYIKRTAIANPHALILFLDPEGSEHIFPRVINSLPKKPTEVKPHPLGISANDLYEYAMSEKECNRLSSFFQTRFSRVSPSKAKELSSLSGIDFSRSPTSLSWDECESIIEAIGKVKWISPSSEGVIPIGKEQIEKSLVSVLDPEFVSVVQRSPKIYRGGIPFIVEVGIAYGGSIKSSGRSGEIMRFANRSPLLFDAGVCAITSAVKSVDWKRYNLKDFESEPVAIFVNLSSVHVPYVSAGKQAISDDKELVDEIKNAVMECARKLKTHISGKHREKEMLHKRKAIMKYVSEFAEHLASLSELGNKEEIERRLVRLIHQKYGGDASE